MLEYLNLLNTKLRFGTHRSSVYPMPRRNYKYRRRRKQHQEWAVFLIGKCNFYGGVSIKIWCMCQKWRLQKILWQKQAIVIKGAHGGYTYNCIFCPNDWAVIKIFPMQNTHTNINCLAYPGVKYIPFPLDFKLSDEQVEVPLNELNTVVSSLLVATK